MRDVPWEMERCERQWQDDARARIDGIMAAAGLTPEEHDAYWARVGYLLTWREVAEWLAAAGHRAVTGPRAERRCRSARAKLVTEVVRRRLTGSPLHPSYRAAG